VESQDRKTKEPCKTENIWLSLNERAHLREQQLLFTLR
jgi:hypothetical protein